jgi:hypothetical protein
MKSKQILLYIFSLTFLFWGVALAQENKTSLKTKMLMEKYAHESSKRAKSTTNDSIENEEKASLFIIVSDNFNRSSLTQLNATIETDLNNILTIRIPIKNIKTLSEMSEIKYVRAGMPVKPRLDVAIPLIGADKVQKGTNLDSPYDGKNVVIGIVDFGLDFTHPTFYSSDGTTLRISRAWLQSVRGIEPSGFSYGTEYVGESALLSKEYSSTAESHGTHVSGIAAGSGGGGIYKGVAPGAEIVFVELGETDTNLIDAVNYIFKYANSENKPAVINLSLGSQTGPHDGTSLIDKSFDGLTGEGKIIVGAAGNEGNTNLHIKHTFSSTTDTLRTIIKLDTNDNPQYESNVDIWGNANSNIQFAIEVYDLSTNKIIESTNFASTSSSYSTTKDWIMNTNDTIEVQLSSIAKYATNQKPNIEFYMKNPVSSNYGVAIVLKGTSGNGVDLWNGGVGYGAEYQALTNTTKTGWVTGDTECSISEIGGTGNSIISVGAYASKEIWINLSGNRYTTNDVIGNIANWSSKGPTIDGRTKPDVTAPGTVIVSSVNSFDPTFLPSGSSAPDLISKDNSGSQTHYYGIMQGTSMSTPMVTGSVALMLEKNPKLAPNDVRLIIQQSSFQDQFTGTIDASGSNTWGWGKLNVYNMMTSQGIQPKPVLSDLFVFYDATTKTIGIFYDASTKTIGLETELPTIDKVEIYNILGQEVSIKTNITDKTISASGLANGVYLLKFYSNGDHIVRKVLIY